MQQLRKKKQKCFQIHILKGQYWRGNLEEETLLPYLQNFLFKVN